MGLRLAPFTTLGCWYLSVAIASCLFLCQLERQRRYCIVVIPTTGLLVCGHVPAVCYAPRAVLVRTFKDHKQWICLPWRIGEFLATEANANGKNIILHCWLSFHFDLTCDIWVRIFISELSSAFTKCTIHRTWAQFTLFAVNIGFSQWTTVWVTVCVICITSKTMTAAWMQMNVRMQICIAAHGPMAEFAIVYKGGGEEGARVGLVFLEVG